MVTFTWYLMWYAIIAPVIAYICGEEHGRKEERRLYDAGK